MHHDDPADAFLSYSCSSHLGSRLWGLLGVVFLPPPPSLLPLFRKIPTYLFNIPDEFLIAIAMAYQITQNSCSLHACPYLHKVPSKNFANEIHPLLQEQDFSKHLGLALHITITKKRIRLREGYTSASPRPSRHFSPNTSSEASSHPNDGPTRQPYPLYYSIRHGRLWSPRPGGTRCTFYVSNAVRLTRKPRSPQIISRATACARAL